jgi:multiple sugar transport system permease protein
VPWLMLAPAALLVAGLVLYPIIYNGILSLRYVTTTTWQAGGRFVGLENFAVLGDDPWFWHALRNTAVYVGAAVVIEVLIGLGLALMVFRSRHRIRKVLILGLLLPHMATPVAAALIWRFMLNHQYGVVNYLLESIGLERIAFTSEPTMAMVSVIAIDVWQHTAFCFLILLAGLMSIPSGLFEASAMDGASARQQLRHVVFPLLVPALVLVVLFRIMGAFQAFDHIYILTRGGPARSTELLSVHLYDTLFASGDFGLGAAMSLVILVLAGLLSTLLVIVMRRRMRVE